MIETYNYLFKELADPRTQNWLFLSSPWPPLGIIMLYLYSIYVFLPNHMANKQPYRLKEVVIVYNVFQIVSCSIIVYGMATSGWTTHYTFGCQLLDPLENKMGTRMASYVWFACILKFIDFIDTILFVLRKKYNQVSIFHVYHHAGTAFTSWMLAKYIPGGMTSFSIILNNMVHVLMYTYYLLSSFGPKMQKKLVLVKSKLTFIQMIQITMIIIHSSQTLLPGCKDFGLLTYLLIPHSLIVLYCFIKFYVRSYVKNKKN